jgi:serine/threonine-protein kinase
VTGLLSSGGVKTGDVVAERYRVLSPIGGGAMAVVWSGLDVHTNHPVALKLVPTTLSPELRRRALREARVCLAVQHPAIVEVFDVVEHGEAIALVMELLAGHTLRAEIDHRRPAGGLPVDRTLTLMLPVIAAVGTAHARGVVHRDLKPDNVFVCRDSDAVKVLDFGVAKLTAREGALAASGELTRSGWLVGTPIYMAPEQFLGEREIDFRADIWSLGVMLYECASGCRPLEASSLGQVLKALYQTGITPLSVMVPDIPQTFASMVHAMLQRDPASRLSDLRGAYVELESLLQTLRGSSHSESRHRG